MNFLLTICSISCSWLQERKEMLVGEREGGRPCKGDEVAELIGEPGRSGAEVDTV